MVSDFDDFDIFSRNINLHLLTKRTRQKKQFRKELVIKEETKIRDNLAWFENKRQ